MKRRNLLRGAGATVALGVLGAGTASGCCCGPDCPCSDVCPLCMECGDSGGTIRFR